jgi:rubrerythrin
MSDIKCKECGATLEQEYLNRWQCPVCKRVYFAGDLIDG